MCDDDVAALVVDNGAYFQRNHPTPNRINWHGLQFVEISSSEKKSWRKNVVSERQASCALKEKPKRK